MMKLQQFPANPHRSVNANGTFLRTCAARPMVADFIVCDLLG